MGPARGINK